MKRPTSAGKDVPARSSRFGAIFGLLLERQRTASLLGAHLQKQTPSSAQGSNTPQWRGPGSCCQRGGKPQKVKVEEAEGAS